MAKIELDYADFNPNPDTKSAVVAFGITGENLERFRRMANVTRDGGDFRCFMEEILRSYEYHLEEHGSND